MHYHIILTELCNSQCRYCYGKSMREENDLNKRFKFDFDAPYISSVSVEKVKEFLKRDKEPTLIFYGGEPLLQMRRVKELIDGLKDVPNIQFRMQTNGKLLDKLDIEYLKKIGKILVSIDGKRELTDFNKGEGTYDKVVGNLRLIRKRGYDGEIVARMCISEFPDLNEQVRHLLELIDEGLFSSIHWQLDLGFYSCDYDFERVKEFIEDYNVSLKKLFEWWIGELYLGRVWKLYPFIGMVEHLFSGREAKLMCGAGHSNWTITTDGNLVACPIMGCMPDFYCGNLDSSPSELREIAPVSKCASCKYLSDCGGRCLYVNSVELWPPEGMDLICSTAKFYIDLVKSRMGEIRLLIESGAIGEKDFEYEKYFGPEIVP